MPNLNRVRSEFRHITRKEEKWLKESRKDDYIISEVFLMEIAYQTKRIADLLDNSQETKENQNEKHNRTNR